MPLRLIEMFLPDRECVGQMHELLEDHPVLGIWCESLSGNQVLVMVLLDTEQSEAVLDLFEKNYSSIDGFRIMILPVLASIPRPEEPEEELSEQKEPQTGKESEATVDRISREELYSHISNTTELSKIYVVLVILSSVVAATGILRDSVAIIIGAMVIAPLLGPNVALSFATTLGDTELIWEAIKANFVGLFVGLVFSVVVGCLFDIDPSIPELASRTNVGLGDVVLALSAGAAGVLSFTTGVASAIIGVMVAVALLPPLVSFGMLLGSQHWQAALGAMLLLLVNITCINLSGITTFLVQGIRPRTWWEADKARKATRIAIILWTLLLLIFVIAILFSKRESNL